MIDYIIQTFVFVILIMDIFVAVTSKVRNEGNFIRIFRHLAYSITPVIYLIMILVIWRITEKFHSDYVFSAVMMFGLAAGCCIVYAENFFTRKKSKKKRIRAKKLEYCGKSAYSEELTPLTVKERS